MRQVQKIHFRARTLLLLRCYEYAYEKGRERERDRDAQRRAGIREQIEGEVGNVGAEAFFFVPCVQMHRTVPFFLCRARF